MSAENPHIPDELIVKVPSYLTIYDCQIEHRTEYAFTFRPNIYDGEAKNMQLARGP